MLVGDSPFGVAAVDVVAGEAGLVAEVLATRRAVTARAARPAEPGDAEASAVLRDPDDLVARDERQLRARELAVDDVEIGPADTTGLHLQQHLTGAGDRAVDPGELERRSRRLKHHGLHALRTTTTGHVACWTHC